MKQNFTFDSPFLTSLQSHFQKFGETKKLLNKQRLMFFINSLRTNKKVTVHFFYCCPEHAAVRGFLVYARFLCKTLLCSVSR